MSGAPIDFWTKCPEAIPSSGQRPMWVLAVSFIHTVFRGRYSVKEIIRAGPKKGAQNQPRPPRSFQGTSEKEEKFKQNQVQ